ncbi:MAG TPA: YdbH domain-containing protein, partial [Phenylobacterium sp.]|uniref:intermembrane phospholipid transport protein YdbH family protein n=1 Tax=Phenylobacterium sp. TaxID=1871053 RepID=UPI002B469D1E
GGAATLAPAGAGWRLSVAGGGLPKVDAVISRVALTTDGATASGRIKAALSIGPIEQGTFDASGALRLAGRTLSFTGDRCALVSAKRLNFGANDARDFANRLCPAGGPLLSIGGGDWRILGRAENTSAEVPFLQAKVAKGAGLMDLASHGGELQAKMTVTGAEVTDAAPQTRFNPVGLSGQMQLARNRWTGKLGVREGAGRPLATIALQHEMLSGRGRADVETGTLTFAPGGLQPAALSPLAASIGSPAEGQARFTGGFAWTPQTQSSSGVLEVPRLDFLSPGGKVAGLSGKVAFSSLAPLVAPPGQALKVAQIASPLGAITDGRVVFGLQPDALRVTDGEAAIGGGLIRIVSLLTPLDPKQPIRGVVELDGMQLHDLVEASPFGDKVDLTAKVSGRVPFTLDGDKVRIEGGSLHAVEPGRLSIQRSALGAVDAKGSVETTGVPKEVQPEASTDTFSDFAYQAMENLAFSTLSAEVNSRPDGRLAVLFHIVGRHDPPQRQVIRLSLLDLIQKKFLNRQLPLPSGTGVNLTLDTTLNLDDLLSDYAEFRRLHGSAKVQP